jgi:hypothetical protein
MTNLINWNKNNILKFSVDSEKIDEDLTDFPLLLNVTAVSGLTGFNCSNFFNELEYQNFTTTTFSGTNGSLPDKDLWTVSSIQKVFINDNNLRLIGTTTEYCESNFLLSGNFDIQVDINDVSGQENNSWSIQLRLHWVSDVYTNTVSVYKAWTGNSYKFVADYNINGTANVISSISNSTNPSKLKIYRISSTCYFSFWDGTTWTSLGSYTTTIYDMQIRLISARWDNYPSATLDFNNFIINEGVIVWPTKKHPNAKKIALVYPSTQEHTVQEYDISDVLVLQSIDQPNGSVVFKDYSQYNKTITVVGNTSHSIAQAKFGTSSIYFDGDGDYLSLPYSPNFDLVPVNFTIECWIFPLTVDSDRRLFSTGGGLVGWNSTNGVHLLLQLLATSLNLQMWNGSTVINGTHSVPIAANVFTFVTASKYGSTVYLSINGTIESFSFSAIRPSTNPSVSVAEVPGETSNTHKFYGYIDDLRITKGVARYTENFTPPNRLTKNNVFKTYNHAKQELLYCEIENFDQINKSAQLWVKIPKILHNQPTDLLLYYDSSQENNTPYVGIIGDFSAQKVWDTDYSAVYHLSQDPTYTILDSTSNLRNGTSAGGMTSSNIVNMATGKATLFNGTSQYISCGTYDPRIKYGTVTMEATYSATSVPTTSYVFIKGNDNLYQSYGIGLGGPNVIMALVYNNSSPPTWASPPARDATTNFLYIAGVISGNTVVGYDSDVPSSIIGTTGTYSTTTNPIRIGATNRAAPYTYYLNGKVREARISQTARSVAWLKASNHSINDDVCTVTSGTLFFVSGYVHENETAIQRTVYLYERSSGDLMDRCVSNVSNGYYLLKTTSSGTHNLVCIDDVDGEIYDDLILSKITPTEVQ